MTFLAAIQCILVLCYEVCHNATTSETKLEKPHVFLFPSSICLSPLTLHPSLCSRAARSYGRRRGNLTPSLFVLAEMMGLLLWLICSLSMRVTGTYEGRGSMSASFVQWLHSFMLILPLFSANNWIIVSFFIIAHKLRSPRNILAIDFLTKWSMITKILFRRLTNPVCLKWTIQACCTSHYECRTNCHPVLCQRVYTSHALVLLSYPFSTMSQ